MFLSKLERMCYRSCARCRRNMTQSTFSSREMVNGTHQDWSRSRIAHFAMQMWFGTHSMASMERMVKDGQVQRELEKLKIPFTGSSSLSSALAINKDMAKKIFIEHSILVPKHEVLVESDFSDEKLIYIFQNYLHPVIIKPSRGSGGIGVTLAKSFNELKEKVKNIFKHSPKAIVEEYIKGKDATCAVVENARGEKMYALIPDGDLSAAHKKEVERLTKLSHQILGLRHYSSSDFVVTPKGKIYLIETNAQPKFHPESSLHQSLHAVGWHPRDFVDHVLSLHNY